MPKAYIVAARVEDVLPELPECTFDASFSDPPYGLGFMGKSWDHGVPSAAIWALVLRTLRPGAPLGAFGGTRTYHRLTVAIEDAGFEIRDSIATWNYGSGFPKSLDVSRAIDEHHGVERPRNRKPPAPRSAIMGDRPWIEDPDHLFPSREPVTPDAIHWSGWGTCLKPSWEPCILAMRPTDGTFAENALTHGVAGLNIDGARIGTEGGTRKAGAPSMKPGTSLNGSLSGSLNGGGCEPIDAGRWPANVLMDEAAAAVLDGQVPAAKPKAARAGRRGGSACFGQPGLGSPDEAGVWPADPGGGPSRFLYVAKASQNEKHLGCEGLFWRRDGERLEPITQAEYDTLEPRRRGRGNCHPTIKPLDFCRWISLTMLPPQRLDGQPRRLLVPFSGSGSEMIGAMLAGWDEVYGIEQDPAHVTIAAHRIDARGFDVVIE